MVYIGMIFQFDSTQGSGLIMLSDGEKKDFTTNEWVDAVNAPAIGQKVSYESNGYFAQIKVASEADEIKAKSEEETKSSKEEETLTDTAKVEFTSLDDCLNYFIERGFKLVKDSVDGELQILTLRRYADGEPSEVIINHNGAQISVTQTVNGKPVVIS